MGNYPDGVSGSSDYFNPPEPPECPKCFAVLEPEWEYCPSCGMYLRDDYTPDDVFENWLARRAR